MFKIIPWLVACVLLLAGCKSKRNADKAAPIVSGQMPNLTSDRRGSIHLVYGSGDSILYAVSTDQGHSFSKPTLVASLPDLAASHMRGPQIAISKSGLVITACTSEGNVFAFTKSEGQDWLNAGRVNDVDTIAKENLMALSADGDLAFAIWLDLREKHNKIFGTSSTDGGKHWSTNRLVYASPDSTVCECCKPSVLVSGNDVYVMFRNSFKGNRDLYVIKSEDGGKSFGDASKLGEGSWALNACPMDGGGMALVKELGMKTVWNREGMIYACGLHEKERVIGRGKNCTITNVGDRPVYAWTENGEVVIVDNLGKKQNLGKGQLPQIQELPDEKLLCVWENEGEIYRVVVDMRVD